MQPTLTAPEQLSGAGTGGLLHVDNTEAPREVRRGVGPAEESFDTLTPVLEHIPSPILPHVPGGMTIVVTPSGCGRGGIMLLFSSYASPFLLSAGGSWDSSRYPANEAIFDTVARSSAVRGGGG
ncbi:hypothetical protein GGTG_08781 [Gaeumannomyces tritici R3-111a-1]|uniref:Uncharacterized protein n=1 Tax=Gaeumannomyces tritici (strain R3-111a-1) TaxID=644352 RepID=J3P5J2_GAET3|nr:hypothetical protein GGTG_08781 [Gaeumannomyces tritici R3-111a-1]EJT74943.1 hypothetical protein GGTG_08781 [Gaeumannomyces tritici R3-111a-1]